MNNTRDKLHQFQSPTPSLWRQKAELRLAAQNERRKARRVAVQILDAMERQNITESALAQRLGISIDELSSFLKGHRFLSSVILGGIVSVLGIKLS